MDANDTIAAEHCRLSDPEEQWHLRPRSGPELTVARVRGRWIVAIDTSQLASGIRWSHDSKGTPYVTVFIDSQRPYAHRPALGPERSGTRVVTATPGICSVTCKESGLGQETWRFRPGVPDSAYRGRVEARLVVISWCDSDWTVEIETAGLKAGPNVGVWLSGATLWEPDPRRRSGRHRAAAWLPLPPPIARRACVHDPHRGEEGDQQ
jgi:hypothetical protein